MSEIQLSKHGRVRLQLLLAVAACSAGLHLACESSDIDAKKSDKTKSSDEDGTDPKGTDPTPGSTDPLSTDSSPSISSDPAVICAGPNPPMELCKMQPSGPACGDAEINQDIEQCDDGNTLPGDGCTGICKVEPNYICPTPGQPCELQIVCGNGIVEPGEVCDDRNNVDDDGCNATCTIQSPNFICPTPGEPCERVVFCGDGRINGDENCEDDDPQEALENGDGCDENCHREEGWVCRTPGEACVPGPRCGDGQLNIGNNEKCDDGNTVGNDGCPEDCSYVEDGWICAKPGDACINTTECGDGKVTGGETCDDANDDPEDGCNNCELQAGFECPFPGAKCLPKCGDGIRILNEICDDGNLDDNDGCSSLCEWEDGFVCDGEPGNYTCRPTVCGDEKVEGTEGCDDGNNNMGDGCTPTCMIEPSCEGGACTSTCGDGLVLESMDEACDDGNRNDDDGCSSTCQVEDGYECKQPPMGETMTVPIVYRDFKGRDWGVQQEGHPDFERGVTGQQDATVGIVKPLLDADGKPEYAGAPNDGNHITSAATFAEWFRDTDSNQTVVSTLTLYDDGNGGYVNRWGENGEQFAYYSDAVWCGKGGSACATQCTEDEYDVCLDPCIYWGVTNTDACGVRAEYMDGNPMFFPVDDLQDGHPLSATQIPPPYSDKWEWEDLSLENEGPKHNFAFTSEVRYWFQYNADSTYTLNFLGDDDVWVFINNRLVEECDLGGIHSPVEGRITLASAADGAAFEMTDGNVYEIVVFQAERQTSSSSYKLTLSGFNASKSKCGPICGDAVMAPGEQCDEGEDANIGGYGACQPDCTRGPYCGDGIVQDEFEQCDDGANLALYGTSQDGCAPGCIRPPYCGDGIVQGDYGETCDDGVNDNTYGHCSDTCQQGPWCGDGIVEEGVEQCDDGLNDGTYNTCAEGCLLPPRCGDGVQQEEWGEECDDGNTVAGDDCSPNCRKEGVCGDAFKGEGEECDDGINDGGYGECGPNCKQGPHCGDGVVESSINPETNAPYEQCDDGINDGGYGECDQGCVLGPHCGDGVQQPQYEECDDGNDENLADKCSNSCKKIEVVPI